MICASRCQKETGHKVFLLAEGLLCSRSSQFPSAWFSGKSAGKAVPAACTESVGDFNNFEDLQDGWEPHGCLSFRAAQWVWPWLSCSWFKSKHWLDRKLLSWLRKMVDYTSRLCHLGQIVTILLLGESLILNMKPMQIHPIVSQWWTVKPYSQFKLNLCWVIR